MKHSVCFDHNGRRLEIKAVVLAGDWQIWVYENGERIYFHSVVPFENSLNKAEDVRIQNLLAEAQRDIQNELIIVPVIRFWPRKVTRP